MSSKSSKTEELPSPASAARRDLPETVQVGRVLRPHGVRGEVKIEVLSDVPDRFAPGAALQLVRDGAAAAAIAASVERTVEAFRPVKGGAIVRFAGCDDREAAEALRGAWLEVPRGSVPPAPPGTYYHYELLGCRCSASGAELGTVVEVAEDGGGLLLIVEGAGGRLPVPFVERYLRRVDPRAGAIELELPEGLVEACASRS
jgi:16S rRNA processing protein RimM